MFHFKYVYILFKIVIVKKKLRIVTIYITDYVLIVQVEVKQLVNF